MNTTVQYVKIDTIDDIDVLALKYAPINILYCSFGKYRDSITNETYPHEFIEYISYLDKENNLQYLPIVHRGIWEEN